MFTQKKTKSVKKTKTLKLIEGVLIPVLANITNEYLGKYKEIMCVKCENPYMSCMLIYKHTCGCPMDTYTDVCLPCKPTFSGGMMISKIANCEREHFLSEYVFWVSIYASEHRKWIKLSHICAWYPQYENYEKIPL